MNCNAELMSNVNISGGIVNNITISNSDIFMLGKTIDLSGSTLILKDNEISGDKINGGTIDNITISEIHGPIDFCNQLMSNVNLTTGIINNLSGTLGNIVFTPGSLLDLTTTSIAFAPNQISGDSIMGGTIPEIAISKLLGAMNCNTQAMTNVNILSGNLTGVTINGSITIATLAGGMNANNQFISNVNIDSGNISNVSIAANSYTGPGIINNICSELETSTKLATVGAILSYVNNNIVKDQDGDTYIIAESSRGIDNDELEFYIAGNKYMTIDSNGNVDISKNLYVNGDASFNSNVDIQHHLIVDGDVSFNSSLDLNHQLRVHGDVSFQKNLM